MYLGIGVIIGLVVTLGVAIACKMADDGSSGGGRWISISMGGILRFVAEIALIAVAIMALVFAAVIGTGNAWALVGGYLGTRAVAVVLELASAK